MKTEERGIKRKKEEFKLSEEFVCGYKEKSPNFGFNGLGEIAYKRSYARVKENGESESWFGTVERVVNGCYNMQRRWALAEDIPFSMEKAQVDAQVMYDKIFTFKFLPPGRGLWAMGTPITEKKKLFASLNNCAFVSTDVDPAKPHHFSRPFKFLMDALMLGVGVGFDTKGEGKVIVLGVGAGAAHGTLEPTPETFVIPDSREGWVESVGKLIDTHVLGGGGIKFDYSSIRPEGVMLKAFGGIASGPKPLMDMHIQISLILGNLQGEVITARAIVDIMNIIGKCVVIGNIRRSAEVAFGSPHDENFLHLKDYEKYPERAGFGWCSNNSIFAEVGMDYTKAANVVQKKGEPGFVWLHNMRKFGRMGDPANFKDLKAGGGNPCLEQTLESYEMCCLVETFPFKHESLTEFLETLKFAYMYAKTVTLGESHWEETNEIIKRNRRIGCSMSGIAQFTAEHGLDALKTWCESGYAYLQAYDHKISAYLGINRSIKTTSVKPSGTVSLLAGATPGVHFPHSRFYIRRIRLGATSDLLPALQTANYHVEQDFYTKDGSSVVVSIPIDLGCEVRTLKHVSMWEQLNLAAFMQRYWADNQVSCTITFDPKSEGEQISHALEYYQYQLKGISFLPMLEGGAYKQMPYEEISEMEYMEMKRKIADLDFNKPEGIKFSLFDPLAEPYCDGETCHT